MAGEVTPPDGSVTFVGNATLIIRYGGFTLLTDPKPCPFPSERPGLSF